YSASVQGAGIIAGGPYYCAAGNLLFTSICMGQVAGTPPNPVLMVLAAQKFASEGKIDTLDHLKAHRIYVYSGTKDIVVKQPAVDALVEFYRELSVPNGALLFVNNVPSGHAVITPDYGNDCDSAAAPAISHCSVNGAGYDQAGVILSHIYGVLNPPAKSPAGKIILFDQKEFAAKKAKMADEGYVYVPQSCASGAPCNVHVAFHGCVQSAKSVGDRFYAHAGYNTWAETNNLIVLYPQVNASLANPEGCWDWFGYTGKGYATKTGPQLSAVKAMVDRLVGAP
ncbi:MAG: hypothetical protein JOZ48_17410, partial [Acidobacteriaceae bacterium]|nr:hypothetical protein [Acidobacteriaceae bacterium]